MAIVTSQEYENLAVFSVLPAISSDSFCFGCKNSPGSSPAAAERSRSYRPVWQNPHSAHGDRAGTCRTGLPDLAASSFVERTEFFPKSWKKDLFPAPCHAQHLFQEIVRLLLQSRADKNAQDRVGTTALIRAGSSGNLEIVRMLVHARAAPGLSSATVVDFLIPVGWFYVPNIAIVFNASNTHQNEISNFWWCLRCRKLECPSMCLDE